jgi:hypothetical protein
MEEPIEYKHITKLKYEFESEVEYIKSRFNSAISMQIVKMKNTHEEDMMRLKSIFEEDMRNLNEKFKAMADIHKSLPETPVNRITTEDACKNCIVSNAFMCDQRKKAEQYVKIFTPENLIKLDELMNSDYRTHRRRKYFIEKTKISTYTYRDSTFVFNDVHINLSITYNHDTHKWNFYGGGYGYG